MKVKASSNFWWVPSQMYLQARTSMSGLNTSAWAARTREFTPSAPTIKIVIGKFAGILRLGLEAQLDAERAARSCRMLSSRLRAMPQKPWPPERTTVPR